MPRGYKKLNAVLPGLKKQSCAFFTKKLDERLKETILKFTIFMGFKYVSFYIYVKEKGRSEITFNVLWAFTKGEVRLTDTLTKMIEL